MTSRSRNSLAHRVLRRLSVVLASCTALVLVGVSADVYNDEQDRQSLLIEKIGHSMAGPVAESIWMVDSSLLQRQLDAMILIPGIARVGVTTFIGQEFQAEKAGYDGRPRFMVRRIPLRHKQESLGQLEIWTDSHYLHGAVLHSVFDAVAVGVLWLVVSLVAVYLVFRREVLRPLEIIASYASGARVLEGEGPISLREQLPVDTNEEFLALAMALDGQRSVQSLGSLDKDQAADSEAQAAPAK